MELNWKVFTGNRLQTPTLSPVLPGNPAVAQSLTALTGSLVLIFPFPFPLTLKSVLERGRAPLFAGMLCVGPCPGCGHAPLLCRGSRVCELEGERKAERGAPGTVVWEHTKSSRFSWHGPLSCLGLIGIPLGKHC